MAIQATYIYTNLVARDWRKLSGFYQNVFGCTEVKPYRQLTGKWLERGTGGTGVDNAQLQGVQLLLPTAGSEVTLEIFEYHETVDVQPGPANRAGFGHIAFAVEDVEAALDAVLNHGGRSVGTIETFELPGGEQLTWVYVRDPEGNIVELQKRNAG